jgi:putative ABC transport system permease protein
MIPLVYSHPEVTQVAPLDGSGGRFQNILSPEEQAKIEARTKAAAKSGKGAKGKAASGQPQERVRQRHGDRRDPGLS